MIIIPTREEFLNQISRNQGEGFLEDFCMDETLGNNGQESFIGSERYRYLVAEVARMPQDPKPETDFMTMAEMANRDKGASWKIEKRIRMVESQARKNNTNHFIVPMQKSKKPDADKLDQFLKGMLGVMITALIICVCLLIFLKK